MTGKEIKNKGISFLLVLSVTIAIMISGYLYSVLSWNYSKGERIGYIQKFSEKGWFCKTWEGELQMLPVAGTVPEKFLFSVRDAAVVSRINTTLGQKVALSYEQHKGIPTTCLGETEYFAVGSRVVQ
jgi:hypothetical protein